MGPDTANAPVREGDVVAGKYRVERTVGTGGMGFVVAARHLALGEPVALKFVRPHRAGNRETVERLMREARATFRLRSEHIVRVHDVGELPSGHLFIVMELLEGHDLRVELSSRGPLPPKQVVSHALDTCEALVEAHALGIVHRDLKPGNLFLAKTTQGRRIVKILDFGMSKLDSTTYDEEPLTRPETMVGTPRYMAPEQWKSSSDVDHRADIWALGIVMYELLTGETPLQALPMNERQARLLAGAIPSPRDVRPEVPEELAHVVLRCLRADPRGRWASASHLSRAIRGAFPTVSSSDGEALEVTRTDVTAVVRPSVQALRAAIAFDTLKDSLNPAPTTLPETPEARGGQAASPERTPAVPPRSGDGDDEFDTQTEVREPLFTPDDYVASSGQAMTLPPKRVVATLKSFEPVAEPVATPPVQIATAKIPVVQAQMTPPSGGRVAVVSSTAAPAPISGSSPDPFALSGPMAITSQTTGSGVTIPPTSGANAKRRPRAVAVIVLVVLVLLIAAGVVAGLALFWA